VFGNGVEALGAGRCLEPADNLHPLKTSTKPTAEQGTKMEMRPIVRDTELWATLAAPWPRQRSVASPACELGVAQQN
jgi:hypothetical protein